MVYMYIDTCVMYDVYIYIYIYIHIYIYIYIYIRTGVRTSWVFTDAPLFPHNKLSREDVAKCGDASWKGAMISST